MIMDTFGDAVSGLTYVVMFVCIVLYVFAVHFMNLFGNVAYQGCLDENQNFRDVPTAMLTLFGISTGDKFTCMAHSCMVQESGYSFAIPGACSEADGTCGEPMKARVLFLVFSVIIMFTMMTLFIDVVLDRYMRLCELNGLTITRDDLQAFCREWQKIDNRATGFILYTEYDALVNGVEDELGERDSETGKLPRVGGLQEFCTPLAFEPDAGEDPINQRAHNAATRAAWRQAQPLLSDGRPEGQGRQLHVH